MPDQPDSSLVAILRHCAAAAPQPLYPLVFSREKGIDRDSLDANLERLRLGGLVQLTPWEQGTGQGYALTPEGQRVLQSNRDINLLQEGKLPERRLADGGDREASPWQRTRYERGETIRAVLNEPVVPYVTFALLLANIGVFLYGLMLAQRDQVAGWYLQGGGNAQIVAVWMDIGAAHGPAILAGQWWRLLGACFAHLGLLHLLFNMYAVYVLGPAAELMWGRWRFLYIYLVAGLGGSCAFLMNNPETLGAGASGALCGLLTSFAVWLVLNRQHLPKGFVHSRMQNLAVVFVITIFVSMMPGVSAAGHFGGAVVGLAAAWLANVQRFSAAPGSWLALAGMALLPVLCVAALVRDIQTDPNWTRAETRLFVKSYLSLIERRKESAEKAYRNHVEPLINRHPERRDPEAIQNALGELQGEIDSLAEVVQRLDDARIFANPSVERARQTGRDLLQAALECLQQAQRCLQATDNIKRHEAELTAVRNRWKELLRKWDQVVE